MKNFLMFLVNMFGSSICLQMPEKWKLTTQPFLCGGRLPWWSCVSSSISDSLPLVRYEVAPWPHAQTTLRSSAVHIKKCCMVLCMHDTKLPTFTHWTYNTRLPPPHALTPQSRFLMPSETEKEKVGGVCEGGCRHQQHCLDFLKNFTE